MLQYTGTPCPRTVTGFCRCFAFRIGKICGHNSIIRNFQFRKFLPIKSNFTAYYTTGISLFPLTFPPISTKLKIQKTDSFIYRDSCPDAPTVNKSHESSNKGISGFFCCLKSEKRSISAFSYTRPRKKFSPHQTYLEDKYHDIF